MGKLEAAGWEFTDGGGGSVYVRAPSGRSVGIGYLPEGSRNASEILRELAIALLPSTDISEI